MNLLPSEIRIKPLLVGIVKSSPLIKRMLPKKTGGTNQAEYCYSVWMRHLININEKYPKLQLGTIAELGPGDTIGIGLAALLSGAKKYYALDIVSYWDISRNLKIFDELIVLFKEKRNIPASDSFPNAKPILKSWVFPEQIITDELLKESLSTSRLDRIRYELNDPFNKSNTFIHYHAPWNEKHNIKPDELDMIYSQAVMEHVDELAESYNSIYKWLKKGGVQSHTIDFKSHGFTKSWNGHWTLNQKIWKLIVGGRNYSINRQPASIHRKLILNSGCIITSETITTSSNSLSTKIASEFSHLTPEDLTTSGVYIIAEK